MTRLVVPFLAAMTWLGLAGPSQALENPKPLRSRVGDAEPLYAPAAGGEAGRATTVILLRHAEKTSKNRYAELSRAGRRRAEALVEELRPFSPEVLYASSLERTQQTLAPLAAAMRLEVKVRPIGDEDAVASEILAEHAGRVVVVCGHSDTLAQLAASLGWTDDFPSVGGFDRIWTVTVPASGAPISLTETRQRFGRR